MNYNFNSINIKIIEIIDHLIIKNVIVYCRERYNIA